MSRRQGAKRRKTIVVEQVTVHKFFRDAEFEQPLYPPDALVDDLSDESPGDHFLPNQLKCFWTKLFGGHEAEEFPERLEGINRVLKLLVGDIP